MSRLPKLSKAKLTDRLITVFLDYGYDGASLKALADATELSKASLYHHFPGGKEEMAAYATARLGARLQSTVLQPLLASGEPRARLSASLDATARYYSGDAPVCLMNVLSLGSGQRLFGKQLRDGLAAWTAGLEFVLRDGGCSPDHAGPLAESALGRIQGALVLCRVQSSRKPLEVVLDALRADLGRAMA